MQPKPMLLIIIWLSMTEQHNMNLQNIQSVFGLDVFMRKVKGKDGIKIDGRCLFDNGISYDLWKE